MVDEARKAGIAPVALGSSEKTSIMDSGNVDSKTLTDVDQASVAAAVGNLASLSNGEGRWATDETALSESNATIIRHSAAPIGVLEAPVVPLSKSISSLKNVLGPPKTFAESPEALSRVDPTL